MTTPTFAEAKAEWLRLTDLVLQAGNPAALRALLLTDGPAPRHVFGPLAYPTQLLDAACVLSDYLLVGAKDPA